VCEDYESGWREKGKKKSSRVKELIDGGESQQINEAERHVSLLVCCLINPCIFVVGRPQEIF
jgi:hypothetical protein